MGESKYQYLFDDPINPGKNYAEYRRISEKKSAKGKALRMAQFRKEYRKRVKRRGRLVTAGEAKLFFKEGAFNMGAWNFPKKKPR